MIRPTKACIGLRSKTGRAIVVVLAGGAERPQVLRKGELDLTDPKVSATFQPYHEVLDLAWDKARVAVRKIVAIIETRATKSLLSLVRELKDEGIEVCGVGIVGAGDRNLEAIGGSHIRAHAAEGLLFRQVLDTAADANNLFRRTFAERDLKEIAESEFARSAEWVEQQLKEMGSLVERPWRADEKAAALAAWLTLVTAEKRRR